MLVMMRLSKAVPASHGPGLMICGPARPTVLVEPITPRVSVCGLYSDSWEFTRSTQ